MWAATSIKMKNRHGQSLLEVIIALAVVLLVVLALVAAVVSSVKSTDLAKRKSQAAAYAQEGMENLRSLRDSSWANFASLATGSNRCFAGPVPSDIACLSCPNLGVVFTRCAKLETPVGNQIKATVTVSWTDAQGTHKSELVSQFSKWQ